MATLEPVCPVSRAMLVWMLLCGRGIVLHESPMVVSSIPPACSWQELLEQNVSILKCTNSLGLSPSQYELTSV